MSAIVNHPSLLTSRELPLICDFCCKDLISLSLVSKKIRELTMCILLTQGTSQTENAQWEKTNPYGLSFPAPFRIALMSVDELKEMTFTNFRTLLGLIPETSIMSFGSSLGFHGTDRQSLKGILEEKKSGKGDGGRPFLCIASYSHQSANKVHFLADLYLVVGKAIRYGDSVVIVKAPSLLMKPLGLNSYEQFTQPSDPSSYRMFVSLFEKRVSSGNLIESQVIFGPSNFSDVILGSLSTQYPRPLVDHCIRRSFTEERLNKGQLMNRLRIQEVIASAFYAMNILPQKSSEESGVDTLLNDFLQEQEEAQLTSEEEIDSEISLDIEW